MDDRTKRRIEALQRVAEPDSGATVQERETALRKIAVMMEKAAVKQEVTASVKRAQVQFRPPGTTRPLSFEISIDAVDKMARGMASPAFQQALRDAILGMNRATRSWGGAPPTFHQMGPIPRQREEPDLADLGDIFFDEGGDNG